VKTVPYPCGRGSNGERLQDIQDTPCLTEFLRAERQRLLHRIRGAYTAEMGEDPGEKEIAPIPYPLTSEPPTPDTRHPTPYIVTESPPGGIEIAQAFSDLMDTIIMRMFALACERMKTSPERVPIAIVATGGYGRRELAPYSDIDITFVPQRDNDPLTDRIIRDLFTQLMEVCINGNGLEVGYAYRLMEDCGRLDHQTVSGLLDARLIVGNERIFIQFEDAFWTGFNSADFIFTKLDERERALDKWGRTPFVVEPQLKEGPGGIRDIHTAVWLVQAREHLVAARVRGERVAPILASETGLSKQEIEAYLASKERLFQVRNALHAVVEGARNELVVTRQEEVAALLGYGDALPDESATPPVERFMSDLFHDLARIRRMSGQIIRHISNSRLILGIGLDCKRRQIVPANDALESDDPTWLLWACELAQKYGLELSERLETTAVNLVQISPVLANTQDAGQVFTRILSPLGAVYPALQRMADLGILGWLLPEFEAMRTLIPYDPSHDYTIGQHSLFVVRNLEALLQTESGEDYVEMRRLLEHLPHPEQLMLAALLHDAGKVVPNRPHAEVGAEMVEAVCRRLGWSNEATENVQFLIRQHLLMAETSRLRDPSVDETIRDFTQVVNDIDRLNMLYLLTYADTRAVGEGVWTPVKGRFLRELWRRTAAVLMEEEPVGFDAAAIARARRRLQKELSPGNLPEKEVAEHVEAMPSHYLLNQSLQQIALHIGFVRRVRAGEIVVDFHEERDAGYTELTVCTYDDPKPGLLAKIVGALFAADLDVHNAQVLTRVTPEDRIALDTLWVDFRGKPLTAGKKREVSANLNAVLSGEKSVAELLVHRQQSGKQKKRGRLSPLEDKPLTVNSVTHNQSDNLSVIVTGGPDARTAFGLVADGLSQLGWDIRSARISVWKGEAKASFYVSGAHELKEFVAQRALTDVLSRAGTE
jgi:[protein-PII] uridylyltransferase